MPFRLAKPQIYRHQRSGGHGFLFLGGQGHAVPGHILPLRRGYLPSREQGCKQLGAVTGHDHPIIGGQFFSQCSAVHSPVRAKALHLTVFHTKKGVIELPAAGVHHHADHCVLLRELVRHRFQSRHGDTRNIPVKGKAFNGGHACQEELKLMMGIVKPQYFIPVHGEQKHLQKHAGLAMSMGYDMKHIYLGNIGEKISLSKTEMKQIETVPAGEVYVDGLGVGDVGNIVLNDRKHLSQDGIIIVVATLDAETGDVVSGPDVVSRGFVYVKENEDLMNKARDLACHVIYDYYDVKGRDWNTVKSKLRDEISHLMYEKTKRSPMVLPILMEI